VVNKRTKINLFYQRLKVRPYLHGKQKQPTYCLVFVNIVYLCETFLYPNLKTKQIFNNSLGNRALIKMNNLLSILFSEKPN
jgi:hypothetical protein